MFRKKLLLLLLLPLYFQLARITLCMDLDFQLLNIQIHTVMPATALPHFTGKLHVELLHAICLFDYYYYYYYHYYYHYYVITIVSFTYLSSLQLAIATG